MQNRKPTKPVCCYFLILSSVSLVMAMGENNTSITVNVGVVLDLDNSPNTNVWLSCIKMALSDFYTSHSSSRTKLVLSIRDSRSEVVDAAAAGFSKFTSS